MTAIVHLEMAALQRLNASAATAKQRVYLAGLLLALAAKTEAGKS